VNFQTVGGLMIYSLISNPAAAAFQVARGCRRVLLLSVVFGTASGLGGFLIAAATDLPSGAVIVLVSSALVGAAAIFGRVALRFAPEPQPPDEPGPTRAGLTRT
jgi:manganese/iron transport system permease protein